VAGYNSGLLDRFPLLERDFSVFSQKSLVLWYTFESNRQNTAKFKDAFLVPTRLQIGPLEPILPQVCAGFPVSLLQNGLLLCFADRVLHERM
jgi:hypothetical protein